MVFYIGCVIIGVISALLGFHIYDFETKEFDIFSLIIVIAVTLAWGFFYKKQSEG